MVLFLILAGTLAAGSVRQETTDYRRIAVSQKESKTAQELLKEAVSKAKKEKKHVMLTFGSPG